MDINGLLADMFMKTIQVRVSDDIVCTGQLTLFKSKNFEFIFTINTKGRKRGKKVSIPYPFDHWILNNGKSLMFDYRVSTLLRGDEDLISVFKKVKKPSPSIFYDTVAYIDILPTQTE